MFFKKCTNQNWGYSFKLQICSDYGPFYFIERQMIHGHRKKYLRYRVISKAIFLASQSKERAWLRMHSGNSVF